MLDAEKNEKENTTLVCIVIIEMCCNNDRNVL